MYKSEKLALSLKHLIESGFWKANDKLPSLRQQAETSGFSLMMHFLWSIQPFYRHCIYPLSLWWLP